MLKANNLDQWWELSYAQFLTIPRLVMRSMPIEWQNKMAELLFEMDATFDWRPHEGRYWVSLRGDDGRYKPLDEGICDYRRGSCEHLRMSSRPKVVSVGKGVKE